MATTPRHGQPQGGQRPAQSSPSTGTQSGGQSVEKKATQATERMAEKAQSTFENARSTVTKQVSAVAQAMGSAATKLEEQDQRGLSQRVQQYVQKAEQASHYLENKSPRELKNDLDRLARERPAWFLGGAFLAGLFVARFIKSSEQRSSQPQIRGEVEYARA